MALSTEQKVRRLAAADGFQSKVNKALVAAATDVKGEPAVFTTVNGSVGVSTYSQKRGGLASRILADVAEITPRISGLIAAQPGISASLDAVDGEDNASLPDLLSDAVPYNDVAFTVNALFNDIAGVDSWDGSESPRGASLTAGYASDSVFQDRVYQIGAGLANSLLVAARPAVVDPANPTPQEQAALAVDGVKRVFALKYQAGRYISPTHKLNYAVNVLASPTLSDLTPEEITDSQILTRLAELVEIFAQAMAAFQAAGIDTGLLV
jgi:hypothetical protein